MLEEFYVQNCFKNHLKSINKPDDTYDVSSPNYKHHVTSQVIENTDGLFTLPQLYCIYIESNEGYIENTYVSHTELDRLFTDW